MKKKIVFLPYDMDTAIGINNEGALVFSYNLEDIDQTEGGADVFNGQQSVLWKNMRAAFFDEMKAMYQNLRSTGKLSYEKVEQMFEEHQAKWPEAIFNEDAWFKYLAPLVEKGNASYLSMLQGSKAEQRKWWLYNRFRYIDSKYNAGDSLSDVITVRGYAKADITVEPYADVYASIKYGSYLVQERSARNTKTTLPCPLDNVNDTEIYIYSASQLADVGDLSGLMVGYADFSKAVKLQALKIGDEAETYSNGNLTELYLGNNELLRTIDVRNCPMLSQAVDLSGCANIEHIYFDGTAITGLDLPKGGIIKTLHLPGTLANLSIIGHPGITDFVLPSEENLTTLRLENIGSGINVKTMLGSLPAGCRTRIIGFEFSVSSESELTTLKGKLDTMRGINESGGNEDLAQLMGTIQINSVTGATVKAFREKYPDINISYKNISSICYFYNYDGTSVLRTATATNGGSVTYSGSTPTKPSSESETYTFVGWSLVVGGQRDPSALLHIIEDRNVYPAFTASVRTFTVRFYVGTKCIQTKSNVPYSTATEYTGETPTNTAESDPTDYEFIGWDKETTSVKSDLNVYAQFRYVGATYKHIIDGNLKSELYNALATKVGNRACYYLASVTSISLPNVETVEEYAFANANVGSNKGTSLLSVSLPQAKTIGQYAFYYQIKMTSLYEHTYTQNTGGSNGANAKPIGFFPFHEYDTVETQPEMNFNTNLNHHFGMSMELSFEIPKDRKAPDPTGYKQPIIYEFSGDDDLWVFVDDELVLDIGGIHQPVTGTINFTTGVISVHGVTTDKTMTFDVGVHTLKMFYMERGGCDSNLSVRFNLPLTIGKGNMRFVKKGTSSDTGLMGAVFGIWDNPTCQGEPYTVAASDRNGIVFKGLPIREEGQKYYLQEMVPPSGYKLDKTIFTLTTTTKDENGDYQFRISVGDTTVSDSDSVYELPIIRNSEESPIQIKVHKEWEDAAEDPIDPDQNVTAKFRINRKRTYSVDPLLTVNLVAEEPEHYNSAIFDSIPAFAGDVLTIEYKHDTAHQGASNGYIRTAGGNQNVLPLPVNSTGDPVSVTYTVNVNHADSNGEINIYIPEAFTQYCMGTEYAGGENPHFENLQTTAHNTITEEDNDYNNSDDPSRIVELSAGGDWEGFWNDLPVTGKGTEPGQIYRYEYYIEEIDVPDGFEVIYLDSNGKPIAGDHSEETNVDEDTISVINRKFVDVPIEKRWSDFSGDNYSWEATFVLEMREIKVLPADPNAEIPPSAPDAVTEWTEVGTDRNPILNTGSTQTPWTLTVQKGVTPPEFTDLPIYRVHSNGTKYKIEYSVSEIAYEVKRGSDVVAKWTRENGLNYIGDARYTPQFIQDAGENGSSIEDYEIIIANVLAGTKVEREIDINIEKAWPDGSDYASNPDTYAKFVLKRYVHEEYRDYSGPNVPTEWVEVTLDTFGDGTGLQTLSVPKGTTIHIVGSIKGNTNANSIKFQQISKTNALINEITHDQNNTNEDPAKFDITFSPQEDQTVKLTQGDNYVVGGRDGFRISDTYGSATVDSKDNTYSKEFTLNQGNNWKEISDHLPLIVESDMDPTDGSQTIYVYSYYLEEVACSPEDFHPEFQVGNTSIKIDQDHRIETTMSLKANNEPNTVDFKIKKVDKKDVNNPDAPTLHGAEFKIVKYSSLSPSHAKDTSWGTNGEKPMTEISETPGIFEIADLTTGYYEIVETKYPDGYITDIPNPFFQVRQTNTIGELETVLVDSTGVPIDGNATDTIIMEDLLLTYGNTPGAALPNTGGPGTNLIYLFGFLMTGLAGAGLVMKRRRRNAA